ncbi:hypothetical protein PHAVU_009G255800 [Phaseolus vulgaris]|uniref:Uncharacterized protein n=1 Tax=Phaseolus vulgaris TaxID=3885 RepID=V7B281_PHAVU|nr:hypothetical protein PHAVU_009G255800g [Phaseolus vulgaris]ESW10988.1 hypothetical protein PHAVU_009G255800g [Phaseolus vulgaris]
MGNIHSTNSYSDRFPLDNYSEVVFLKTKNRKGREVVDTWRAEYHSFGRTTCELQLTKTTCSNHEEELRISVHDHAASHANDDFDFQMNMSVEDGLLLANVSLHGPRCMQQLPERKIPVAQGGVLKSSSFLYGRDTDRKGLVIILREKRCDDDEELPHMITVKHWFVAARCSQGVSVVAKVRSNDGGLSVEIEKPSKHSKGELLKMFDDVKEKGWCPGTTSCDGGMEFSNQNNGNVLPVMNMSGHQNISSLLSSAGYNDGNYNGSVIFRGCKILFDSAFFHPRNWSNMGSK